MPPRARQLPEFLRSPMLGELIAAAMETAADPRPATQTPGQDGEHRAAPTPNERAHRSMLARTAAEIRTYHAEDETP